MKRFKNFFIAILLLSVLSISIVLCACTPNNSRNSNKNQQQSGEVSGNVEDDEIIEPYSLALT